MALCVPSYGLCVEEGGEGKDAVAAGICLLSPSFYCDCWKYHVIIEVQIVFQGRTNLGCISKWFYSIMGKCYFKKRKQCKHFDSLIKYLGYRWPNLWIILAFQGVTIFFFFPAIASVFQLPNILSQKAVTCTWCIIHLHAYKLFA